MLVEATLDFPEEEIDFLGQADTGSKLADIRASLELVISQAKQGSLLRNGMRVVLAGLPNVGKSSLLNRLTGEDRAIVTEIPGTTRDALREQIQIEGIPLHVIDTAGLRDAADAVERLGIQRSWQEIEQADVILHLVDANSGWMSSDNEIEARLPQGITHIVVANKIDLCGRDPVREMRDGRIWISISAMNGAGLDLLRTELLRLVGWRTDSEDVFLARERHLVALRASLAHVTAAAECISAAELFAEELRLAQVELAAITGEFTADDLLGEIFSRFCIGK
jgi:tRNA modification GTPase